MRKEGCVLAFQRETAYRAAMAERVPFLRSAVFKILVFILGTTVLAALLAPPLYLGGKHAVAQGWLEGGWLDSLHGSMERARFSRYFNRAVLVSALLLIAPTLRWMRSGQPVSTTGRKNLAASWNLDPNPRWLSHLLIGFVVAGGSLLLLGAFYVHQGWYLWRETDKSLAGILAGALGTGMAVGFLEEFVFRGALQAVVTKWLRPVPAFLGIAAFFALVHFFNAPRTLEPDGVGFLTGFWMIGKIFEHFFSQFANPSFLLAEFAVLFAIGLVLGYTRLKTRSLWLGIGLHAGWVFGVKTLSPITARGFEAGEMMPWLGETLRVGAVSCLVVALTGLGLWLWLRRRYGDPFEVGES